MNIYKFQVIYISFFILSLTFCGCITKPSPKVTEISLDLLTIFQNSSAYDAVVIINSTSGERKIPVDAFFVETGERFFFFSDTANVSVLRAGNDSKTIESGDIYVIHLLPSDKYLEIRPQSHDLRILARLIVKPDARTFANATGYIVNSDTDEEREGFIVPRHKVGYYNGKIIVLEDCMVGEKGKVIQSLAEGDINPNLTVREGFTLKRVIYDTAGADALGVVMAVHRDYGFSVEPMNAKQAAFLFAFLKSEKEALRYLQFLMHDTQYSAEGRSYKEITTEEELSEFVETIKEQCKEIKVEMRPPTNATIVEKADDRFVIERIYYIPFQERIIYVKAIVYENGEIEVVEGYNYITGCVYRMPRGELS